MHEFVIPWAMFQYTFTDHQGKERTELLGDNRREIRLKAKRRCEKCGAMDREWRVIPNPNWQKAKEAIREMSTRQAGGVPAIPLPVPVLLRVIVHPPSDRMPDSLALAKLLKDALEGVAYINDRQVKGDLWKLPPVTPATVDSSNPRLVVRVEPWR